MNALDMPANSGHPISPINMNTLNEYMEEMGEDGKESLSRLIDIFLNTTPKLVEEIRSSYPNLDLYKLNRASHSLKSSSAIVGADRLSALCLDLEQKTRIAMQDGGIPPSGEIQSDVEEIISEFQSVLTVLDKIKKEL